MTWCLTATKTATEAYFRDREKGGGGEGGMDVLEEVRAGLA